MSSSETDFNNTTPVGYYLGGLAYFITFVLVGSYCFFRMPFL